MSNIQEEVEDKVIDQINFSAGGRLVIFKPEKGGLKDLVVKKRSEYEGKEILLQVNFLEKLPVKNFSIKDFLQEKINPKGNFYLMFVYFSEANQEIESLWLVPSLEIEENNKFSKYIIDKKQLGTFLINAFGKTKKADHSKDYLKKNIIQ